MNWINLRVSDLRAPEFLGSDPLARATWLAVLAFCTDQENGGRIVGGGRWTNRQWQSFAGVTLKEIALAAPLLTIQGDDVLVWNYPLEKEIEVRAKREQARAAALCRWSKEELAPLMRTQCATHAPSIRQRNAEVEVEKKEKVSQSVARGRERETPPPTNHPDCVSSCASASPAAQEQAEELDVAWLERLAREWPRLDIPAEIDAANRKRPNGFDRPWFEARWLPHAKPRIAAASRPPSASHVKSPVIPEPDGWRTEIEGTNYGPGGVYPVKSWAELPADVQKLVAERLRARTAAHA